MNRVEKIGKQIRNLERCIYACSTRNMKSLYPIVDRVSKNIGAILECKNEKLPERTSPDFLPPREDIKVRYKKEDIREEDISDYKDTLFDPDLK